MIMKDSKKISIKDLAAEAGVSTALVSLVLNNRPNVADETRSKIKEAVRRLGYSRPALDKRRGPRPGMRMPRKNGNKCHEILLVASENINLSQPLYMDLIEGAQKEAQHQKCRYSISRTGKGIIDLNKYFDFDGLIIFGSDDFILPKNNIPCVGVMGDITGFVNINHVTYNNPLTGKVAADYIYSRKHKKVAVFCEEYTLDSLFKTRAEAFINAMKSYELPVAKCLFPLGKDVSGYVDELLKNDPDITAIFSCADIDTVKLYMALYKHGINIPEDIEVVSCNNEIPLLASIHPTPPVVDIHAREIGRSAVKILLNRIAVKNTGPLEKLLITPELVINNN